MTNVRSRDQVCASTKAQGPFDEVDTMDHVSEERIGHTIVHSRTISGVITGFLLPPLMLSTVYVYSVRLHI
jgi:hypothetical protein